MQDVRSKNRPTKLESVSRLITLFRTFNQAKGLSSVTIKWYDENLSHFAKEYGSSFTSENILSFFAHLQNEHSCHAVTVNMYFRSLRAFFNFCVAQKLVNENPLQGLRQLKVHKTIHQIPSMETLGKALTRLQGYKRTGARDVAIFLLLLDCGFRPGEIINICLQDINWVENRIMVDGKTGQRIVPFSPKTRRALQSYLKVSKREEGEDTLFLSEIGQPLNRNALRLIFIRLKEKMKLPNRFYPFYFAMPLPHII